MMERSMSGTTSMAELKDARGEHLGEFDPRTGQQTKGTDLRKRVEP